MNIRWESEAEMALRAVSQGGEMTFDRPEKIIVETKESLRDVVTELDLRIERRIRSILEPSGHSIIGEESFSESNTVPLSADATQWLIDPIDGTANYVTHLPYYAVSVGLRHDDVFVTGAVAIPVMKELFFTFGDCGGYLNGKPIRIPDAVLKESLVAATFSGVKGNPVERKNQYALFGELNDSSRGVLRLGSAAVNICYVAAGRFQAAYGLQAQIWDVAGGLAVARQAGCKILYSHHPKSTRVDYIVGAPTVANQVQKIFAKHGFRCPESGRL